MSRIFLVGGKRSPFGDFGGSLKDVTIEDISAQVMQAVVEQEGVEKSQVEEIYWGVGNTSESTDAVTPVVARQALLSAGFPVETVSLSMDRACCSSTAAIQVAFRALKSGEVSLAMAGGVEMLSRTPFLAREMRFKGKKIGQLTLQDPLWALGYRDYSPVSVDAGEVAVEYGINREEQDLWAFNSQRRYQEARQVGKFEREIAPVALPAKKGQPSAAFAEDEFPKADTSLERLAKLPTIYGSPTCTAGNSPGLNDGASALLLATEKKVDELGLTPLAEVVAVTCIAEPARMLAITPARAIAKTLNRLNLGLDDLKLIEINEAFAAVPLVSTHILGEGKPDRIERIRAVTNANGGAIAIGHPLAASGARLVMTLAYELRRRGGGYGIAAICGGLAQGDDVLLKI